MANPFDDYEVVGTYSPPARRSTNLFKDFEYVRDIPTVGGQFQEGGTAFLRGVGTSAVAVPLKGASIFETFREKVVDEGLREEIDRQFERAKNPIRPNDRTLATRELRRIANLHLGKDERKELWNIAGKLEKGDVPEEELKKEAEEKLPFYVPPKKPEERTAYKAGERVEQFLEKQLPVKPGYEGTLGVELGGSLGSTAGSIAQSVVGGPATLLAGSALQGIEEQYERATTAGLKGDEAVKYAMQGAGPGALGTLSTEFILRKVPKAVRNKMLNSVTDVAASGASEAMMEGLQQTIQNAIEMQYNKEREVLDGTPFAAGMGAGAGAILRGVVLASTRGKGIGANGGAPDYMAVQEELAAEEFKLRQKGTGDAETGAPDRESQRAKTPKEAAEKGEVADAGKPVTVIWPHGESFTGYERSRTPDGQYEVVDRDGVVSIIEPGEATIEQGWEERKSDADIEKTLEPWLKSESPWPKVTVETEDGVTFKAVEGPPLADKRQFRDGNGDLHPFDPGIINVIQGWDAEAQETPKPVVGEVAAAQAKMEPLTDEDRESPLSNEDIALGKQTEAEDQGVNAANEALAKVDVPPVGTEVMVKDEGRKPERVIIQDATADSVKVLNSAGVIKTVKSRDLAPKIAPIPVERTAPRTGKPQGEPIPDVRVLAEPTPEAKSKARLEAPVGTDVPLPAFLGPQGRTALTEPQIEASSDADARGAPKGKGVTEGKISATPDVRTRGVIVPKEEIGAAPAANIEAPTGTEIEPPSFLNARGQVAKTAPGIEAPKGVATDDQGERQKSRLGGEVRESPRDKTKQPEGKAGTVQAGVRDTEVKGAAAQVDRATQLSTQIKKGKTDVRQDQGQVRRQGEIDSKQGRPEGGLRQEPRPKDDEQRRAPRYDEGAQRQGQGLQKQDVEPKALASPAPDTSTKSNAERWWDTAPEADRRKAVSKAGYSAPEQRMAYTRSAWSGLPAAAQTNLRLKNAEAIKSYAGVTSEVTTRADKEPSVTPEQVSSTDLEVRKSGKPFDSEASALMAVSPETHRAVRVEGGWARQPIQPAVTPQATQTQAAPEPNVSPLKQETPYVKKSDLYLNKEGQAFTSKTDATAAAQSLGEGHKVVSRDSKGKRGWAVRALASPEGSMADVKPSEPARGTSRRIPTKDYDDKRSAVRAQLQAELDKMGLSDVRVDTPDKIGDLEGSKSIDDSRVAVGRSRSNLIEVALTPERDYRKTLRHESVHAMRNLGLFKDPEWRTLERDAKADKAKIQDVKSRYAKEGLTDEALVEEAIADKFADYVDGSASPRGFIRTAYEKVRNFLKALGNALRGNGFRTASDVYQSMASGEVGARPRTVTPRDESKAQIARSEEQADVALKELRDPSAGLVDPEMRSRIREGDEFFADDIGIIRRKAITPRTIASFSPEFAPVYGVAKHQSSFREKVLSDLGHTYKPYQQLGRVSKKNVSKVLELGRLYSKVYKPSADGTITVTAKNQTATMKAGETVTLSAEEVEAYQSVRSMMDMALGLFRDQTVRDFGFDSNKIKTPKDALALIGPKTPPSVRDKIQTLAKMMTDIQQSGRTGYVPFTRFGNIVVVAKKMNEATGQYETVHSETVEIKGWSGRIKKLRSGQRLDGVPEIKKLKAELAQRYPGSDIRAFQVASKEDTRPDTDKDVLTELLQLPPDQVAGAVQKMQTEALSKGFRKHFFGAKNVPGYTSDIERSIADYVVSISGYIARKESHQHWEQSIESIPSNMPKLKEYAKNYREYFNSPSEDWAAVRQAGFIYYLAGNVSNAALNLTQVPMVTVPYLSMFGNEARVSFEVSRAYKDALKMVGGSLKDQFNPDRAPADVRDALKNAWDENTFTPMAMFDIMGVAYNRSENLRSLSAKARKVLDFVAIPQTSTERFNRIVTYIAAYRLANKNPEAFRQKASDILKDNALARDTVLAEFSPDAFARHSVDETQYDMGKINRAELMRGPGAAIFQFKGFLANTLELHYKLGTIHGKQGMKAVGLMWVGLVATAGLWGAPFAEDAADLGEMLYKWWTGIDVDTRTAVREMMVELTGSPQIAQLITNGSTRALGLDMTNRIGLGKVAPRTSLEAGGVPASLLYGQTTKALTYFKEGRIVEGLGEMAPLFMKNPITAMQWHNQGIRTMAGDPVFTPDEVTAGDIAAKTLGFTPSKVAERRAMEWAQTRATKATQDIKSKYYRRMARAIIEMSDASDVGDDAEFLKIQDKYISIIDEIQAHNEKVIEAEQYHKIIKLDDRALQKRIQAEFMGRGIVREQTAPKVTRPRMQELREIYGDAR